MRDSRKKLFGGSLKANLTLFFDQTNHSQFNFMSKSLLFKDLKKMLIHVNFYMYYMYFTCILQGESPSFFFLSLPQSLES